LKSKDNTSSDQQYCEVNAFITALDSKIDYLVNAAGIFCPKPF
jgi:hypothetical protein